LLRALRHYWRINLAVVVAVAVNSAVLTGALLVGDSVRGSLADLTLDRLGQIELAVVAERFFREELAEELVTELIADEAGGAPASSLESVATRLESVAPALLLRGSVVQADSRARASHVGVHGIDERFAALFGTSVDLERQAGQIFPSVIINESLARELNATVGDPLGELAAHRDAGDSRPWHGQVRAHPPSGLPAERLYVVTAATAGRGAARQGQQPAHRGP